MRAELTNDQLSMLAVLVAPNGYGARRAWVSLPLGAGKHFVAAHAISRVLRHAPITRVLYATCKPMMQHIAPTDVPSRILLTKHAEAPAFEGVTVISHAALRAGFDTWVQYGYFDLIVIDGVPHHLWGTTKLGGAVRTVLTWPTKVWLIGEWV